MNAKSASTTFTAAPAPAPAPAAIGSATAALLAQVPDDLAELIRAAVAEDLLSVFSSALGFGRKNLWDALESEGITGATCRPWCAEHITTTGDGELCIGQTVRLDFDGPNRGAGHIGGVELGLGYSDDEGDSVFIKFPWMDAANMGVDDLQRLVTAGQALIDDATGRGTGGAL